MLGGCGSSLHQEEHALIYILAGICDPCVERWMVWEANMKAGRCFESGGPAPGSEAGAWTTGEEEVVGMRGTWAQLESPLPGCCGRL